MEQRLAVLQQAGVISLEAQQGCLKAVACLNDALSLQQESEQYQMAITHLARAADRVWQHTPIEEGLDAEILQEIEEDPDYSAILNLHQRLLVEVGLTSVPKAEESFMLANVYALYQLSNVN
ncbi:hypothetical protein [Thaumasiovibrio subtropicus]|uniref:hypothetical protein n=1 Tax=Thaumasiovibrio subtropicus TaxID=1891207 RepID=UPI000B351145|nr:hypothetical protein [Thaumasiovibrio subtropicus]